MKMEKCVNKGKNIYTVPAPVKKYSTQSGQYTPPEKPYIPFDHRKVEHPNSDLGSFAHLIKASLGTGILAMPMAFKSSGLVNGVIGTIFIGLLCTHCIDAFVKCCHELCIRAKVPSLTYADTVGTAFQYGPEKLKKLSKFVRNFIDGALIVTPFLGLSVFIVLISDATCQLSEYYFPGLQLAPTTYTWLLFIPIMLLSQIRELKFLVPFSMFANILLVLALSIIMFYSFRDMQDISNRVLFNSMSQIPSFFSTVIFAVEGIASVMPVENGMKNPDHFLGCPGVLNFSMGIVTCLYIVVGFFGYLAYGDNTATNISMSLNMAEIPAQISKICIPLAVFFTCGIQFYTPIDITWTKLIKPRIAEKHYNIAQIISRIVLIFLAVVIAVVVKDLEHFIGFVGSVCYSLLGLLIPAIVETVIYWEYDLGWGNWKLVKNVCIGLLAIVAMISGAFISIQGIIEAHQT